jgi:hypothetical protein
MNSQLPIPNSQLLTPNSQLLTKAGTPRQDGGLFNLDFLYSVTKAQELLKIRR